MKANIKKIDGLNYLKVDKNNDGKKGLKLVKTNKKKEFINS